MLAAAAGGPGAGASEGELSDPHGGGGGREQRGQRHRRLGEQTAGKCSHLTLLTDPIKSLLRTDILMGYFSSSFQSFSRTHCSLVPSLAHSQQEGARRTPAAVFLGGNRLNRR